MAGTLRQRGGLRHCLDAAPQGRSQGVGGRAAAVLRHGHVFKGGVTTGRRHAAPRRAYDTLVGARANSHGPAWKMGLCCVSYHACHVGGQGQAADDTNGGRVDRCLGGYWGHGSFSCVQALDYYNYICSEPFGLIGVEGCYEIPRAIMAYQPRNTHGMLRHEIK